MRVLLSTGVLYGVPPSAALRLAAESGCDGVELVLDPWSIALGADRMRRMAGGYGLPVVVVHPSLFGLPGWRYSEDAFSRLARYAVDVGSTKVVLHPPRPSRPDMVRGGFDRGLEAMRKASGDSLSLLIENVAVFHPSDIHHACVWPEKVARFAGDRRLKMTFDTTHLASTGADLVASYDAVHARVGHVHLSDFRVPHRLLDRPWLDTYIKHHRLPGDGDLDIAGFLERLCRRGYGGDVTLELSPVALKVWQPWRAVKLLRRGVDMVKDEVARVLTAMAGEPPDGQRALDVAQPVGA